MSAVFYFHPVFPSFSKHFLLEELSKVHVTLATISIVLYEPDNPFYNPCALNCIDPDAATL